LYLRGSIHFTMKILDLQEILEYLKISRPTFYRHHKEAMLQFGLYRCGSAKSPYRMRSDHLINYAIHLGEKAISQFVDELAEEFK